MLAHCPLLSYLALFLSLFWLHSTSVFLPLIPLTAALVSQSKRRFLEEKVMAQLFALFCLSPHECDYNPGLYPDKCLVHFCFFLG